MQVSYSKDLANHVSPKPHGGCGNAMADARGWGSVGGTLSSEITTFRVPTLLPDGEGHVFHSDIASYGGTWRSLSTLACAEASCAGIGRSQKLPPCNNWNRGVQSVKISWCIRGGLTSMQALDTKTKATRRMGRKRRNPVQPTHIVSGKSDNNIVPEKQANKREHYRPGGACGGKGVD